MKHFLTIRDNTTDEIEQFLEEAAILKKFLREGNLVDALKGKTVGMIFHKPSLRTRVSFEAGVAKLGGNSMFMEQSYESFGVREPLKDHANVISRYVDGIVIRTFSHEKVEEFSQHCSVPVINGLTDYSHPCQAVTDLFTLKEHFGSLKNQRLAFIGDGNNVSRSLANICVKLKVNFVLGHPKGYGFSEKFLGQFTKEELKYIETTENPQEAAKGATAFYSDVFTSMGQEEEQAERLRIFAPYQVNKKLVDLGDKRAVILHCLPAHRGEEITAEVIDGPNSIIYEQAENRMHTQNAIMKILIGN